MEEAAEFQDWELLHGPDTGVALVPSAAAGASRGAEGAIKPDYFAHDTESCYSLGSSASSDGGFDGDGLPGPEDPCRVEPGSGSRVLPEGPPSGDGLGFEAVEFPRPDDVGFSALGESPDGEEAPAQDHVEGPLDGGMSPQSEAAFEGVTLAGIEETGVVEAGSEESSDLGSGDSPNAIVAPESPVERSVGNNALEGPIDRKREKAGMVWWKLPIDILKFCVFRIRPVWSISIAAALLGIVMLGRRLYKKKLKSRSVPLKVSLEDKRVSQFMVRTGRLHEAFSVVKRVPVIRSTLSTAGVSPWPVVALR